MRILYLRITDEYQHIFGYDAEPVEKKSTNAPARHAVTTTGYHPVTDTDVEYAELKELLFYTVQNKKPFLGMYYLLEKLLIEDTVLIPLGSKAGNFLIYMNHGHADHSVPQLAIPIKDEKKEEFRKRFKELAPVRETYKEVFDHIVTYYDRVMIQLSKSGTVEKQIPADKYWKKVPYDATIFYGKYLIIDPQNYYNDGIYRLIAVKYPDSKELGRRLTNVTESVVYTKTLPDYILTMITRMLTALGTEKRLFVIDIATLSNERLVREVTGFVEHIFTANTQTQYKLMSPSGEVLAYTVYPPGLSTKIISNVNFIDSMQAPGVDIMGEIFTTDDKGKRIIKPSIPMSGHALVVSVDGANMRVVLGIDTIPRNALKRLEKTIIKFELRVIKEKGAVRYFTHIETTDLVIKTRSPQNSLALV